MDENASNALFMAVGVLIGIMLLSILVVSFNSASDLAKSYDSRIKETSVQAFNSNFDKYAVGQVTIHDIITVANFAQDYNKRNGYKKNDAMYISVLCNNYELQELSNEKLLEYMKKHTFTDENNTELQKYECIGNKGEDAIQYNEKTGLINRISFMKKNE